MDLPGSLWRQKTEVFLGEMDERATWAMPWASCMMFTVNIKLASSHEATVTLFYCLLLHRSGANGTQR